MENESLLEELVKYQDSPTTTIPQHLEEYLVGVAKNGYTLYPWQTIKTLFKVKLEKVIADFADISPAENVPTMPNVEEFKFEEMKTRIFEQLESYTGVPFTIQRLCELITQPYSNYKRIDKFLRGLERVMLVVSTIDPLPAQDGGLLNGTSSSLQDSVSILTAVVSGAGAMGAASAGIGAASHNIEAAAGSPKPDISGLGEPSKLNKPSDIDQGGRRLGDSLESPAKRMRLSIEEDGGPCDSVQDVGTPECLPNPAAVLPSTSPTPADSTPEECGAAAVEDGMEIDAECTSSQARLELNPGSEKSGSEADHEGSEADPEGREADPESAAAPAQPEAAASSVAAASEAAVSQPTAAVSNPPKVADETDGVAAAAMDIECGAEEGISTSAESAQPQLQQQVETNSEAEASTAEAGDTSAPVPELAEPTPEAEQSSEVSAETRTDENVGVADSSDEAEQPRATPLTPTQPGQPDQSESAATAADQSESTGGVEEASAEATATDSLEPAAATAEGTAAATTESDAAADEQSANNSPDQSL